MATSGPRRVLCVAEKHSVARGIATILSNGRFQFGKSYSKFNPVMNFYRNDNEIYTVTSVSGHVKGYKFPEKYSDWANTPLDELFDAQLEKDILPSSKFTATSLKRICKDYDELILWLDCDREGENIAFDVLDIIQNENPSIDIYRAKFSAVTPKDVTNAMNSLERPNKNLSNAVNMRQEIDLKLGATFTRFQTLNFSKYSPGIRNQVLSYGPCQFPTLGLVVDRFKEINSFVPEQFWSLKLTKRFKIDGKMKTVKFHWKKERIYDEQECEAIFEEIKNNKNGVISSITKEKKFRRRPEPLNTIGLQKLLSREFNLDSKVTMEIAEKLYNMGYISYPRTETTIFSKTINLRPYIQEQMKHPEYSEFAEKINSGELWGGPVKGKLDDKAHPPIHPVKYHSDDPKLEPLHVKVYDFIVKHFLACVSKDAVYNHTKITAKFDEEEFIASGNEILEQNYLEIYNPYKFSDSMIGDVEEGRSITPAGLKMEESSTQPPPFLSESALITLMDKHGIGTDATIHEHISKIQMRGYAIKEFNMFKPTPIGYHLLEAYSNFGFELGKPEIRADMERDMKKIAEGEVKDVQKIVDKHLNKMRKVLHEVENKKDKMEKYLGKHLVSTENKEAKLALLKKTDFMTCDKCKYDSLIVRYSRRGQLFVACEGFPSCRNTMNLPEGIKFIKKTKKVCPECEKNNKGPVHIMKLQFSQDFLKDPEISALLDGKDSIDICICKNCDARMKRLITLCRRQNGKLTRKHTFITD
ncbi:unnamed protein product [Moneuplotes crassus]|uniref:DNA topoisomerase n=2 Tax=Euplotes crassus TaxID=5936 RepID=A0AAD1Y678_EUPCR|nr:unnamed protein product [Moneuplotes crassus]